MQKQNVTTYGVVIAILVLINIIVLPCGGYYYYWIIRKLCEKCRNRDYAQLHGDDREHHDQEPNEEADHVPEEQQPANED